MKIPEVEDVIEKTDEDVEFMKKMTFSASSIEKYLSCPAKFYYTYVKRLKVETEVSESLDNSMLGTVFMILCSPSTREERLCRLSSICRGKMSLPM